MQLPHLVQDLGIIGVKTTRGQACGIAAMGTFEGQHGVVGGRIAAAGALGIQLNPRIQQICVWVDPEISSAIAGVDVHAGVASHDCEVAILRSQCDTCVRLRITLLARRSTPRVRMSVSIVSIVAVQNQDRTRLVGT